MMKIVFFGTSSFAAQILSFLFAKNFEIVAVVTRPDRARGRALHHSPPPVKEIALTHKLTLPIFQPEKVSAPEFAEILRTFEADLFLVVAYGQILKKNLLEMPLKGCINIHASLLPKYRGAAPIQRCLMDGCKETGITIMEMSEQMDAGDIIEIAQTTVTEEMTFGELEKKLCDLACALVQKVLEGLKRGPVKKNQQNHVQATFAPKLTAQEEEIHWNLPAEVLHNLIRALSPHPAAWCKVKIGSDEKRMKIKRARVITTAKSTAVPGAFLSFGKEGWVVACGSGALQLLEVQLEGKKLLKVEEFIRGMQQSLIFL